MSLPEVQALHSVTLMGFTGFEQQALESYLKLARSRTPAYAPCASLDEAQFIIANGDRGGVLDLLGAAQRMGDSLVVGSQTRPGAAGWLERPIDPLHLFRALDDAVKRRSLAATAARANPRNVTMAELGNAWSDEEQRRAAFFNPAPAVARPPDIDMVARPAAPRAAVQASPLPETSNLRPEQRRPSAIPSNETLTALIVRHQRHQRTGGGAGSAKHQGHVGRQAAPRLCDARRLSFRHRRD